MLIFCKRCYAWSKNLKLNPNWSIYLAVTFPIFHMIWCIQYDTIYNFINCILYSSCPMIRSYDSSTNMPFRDYYLSSVLFFVWIFFWRARTFQFIISCNVENQSWSSFAIVGSEYSDVVISNSRPEKSLIYVHSYNEKRRNRGGRFTFTRQRRENLNLFPI